MEQGSRKNLAFKLSGAAFGLVAMLSISTALGPLVLSEKTSDKSATAIAYKSAEPRSAARPVVKSLPAPEDLGFAFVQEEELRRIAETSRQVADVALREALVELDDFRAEKLENLIEVHAIKIESLNEAIAEIVAQQAIPEAIKINVVTDLEGELEKARSKLSELENRAVTFSYKISEAALHSTPKYQCDETIVVDECDGTCEKETETNGNSKGSVEAFYWI